MDRYNIVLFGESEKGEFQKAYFLKNLTQLVDFLGNPPPNSFGLYFAVQALLYQRNILFFRVREEGYSYPDYLEGLRVLESQEIIPEVAALCLPGVGDIQIIHAMIPYCKSHHSFILTSEYDLYDYLTC